MGWDVLRQDVYYDNRRFVFGLYTSCIKFNVAIHPLLAGAFSTARTSS